MRINNRQSKDNVEGRYWFPAIHDSQFTIHNSQFIIHNSPFTFHHSPPSIPPLQHRDKRKI